MTDKLSLLPLLNSVEFTRMDVKFRAEGDYHSQAWPGAEIRNRFLCCCEAVPLEGGCTLREHIDTLPLSPGHFLYGKFEKGFPKALFWDAATLSDGSGGTSLIAGEEYSISLIIVGSMSRHLNEIQQAIGIMFGRGLGTPAIPTVLLGINVRKPLRLQHFAKRCYDRPMRARLTFPAPVSLFQREKMRYTPTGYQFRMNGFPSYYQLVSSAVYRLSTLCLLYGDGSIQETIADRATWEEYNEALISLATAGWTESAAIQYTHVHSTPKKGEKTPYILRGYVGEMLVSGVDPFLIPVIKMMALLGVGNEIHYGLGYYKVKI